MKRHVPLLCLFALLVSVAVFLASCDSGGAGPNVETESNQQTLVKSKSSESASATDFEVLFGPERFERKPGKPKAVTRAVSGDNFDHFTEPFVLHVRNGNENGEKRVSSAKVWLDGKLLFGPSDFSQQDSSMKAEVPLTEKSELKVKLASNPGGYLAIRIKGKLKPGHSLIPPNGGTAGSADGNLSIAFPDGAFKEETFVVIEPASRDFPELGPGREVSTGPYYITSDGGDLQKPAELTFTEAVNQLIEPEIWVFRDEDWIFKEPTDGSESFITTELNQFSWWTTIKAIPLPEVRETKSVEFSKTESHGIGKDPSTGNRYGWVRPDNVTIAQNKTKIEISGDKKCDDEFCSELRGEGGEIMSNEFFGKGWFTARVKVQERKGSRYSFFLYNGDDGTRRNPEDEATIELDYTEQGKWRFLFTTFRREGGELKTTNSVKKQLSGDDFDASKWHLLSIHRTDEFIKAYLDGKLMGQTGRLCRRVPYLSCRIPRGEMRIMANAWAPSNDDLDAFDDAPDPALEAQYEIDWIAASPEQISKLPGDENDGVDLENGLVAYYPFNGNADDESGNGIDGAVNGATLTTDRFGETNSAYEFDGSDDYIETSSSSALAVDDSLSISAWVKREFSDRRALSAQGTRFDTGGNWQIFVFKDSLEINKNNRRYSIRKSTSLSKGRWDHIALTFASGTTRFFVNGQLEAEGEMGTSTFNRTDDGIKIGEREYGPASNDFKGKIDEFRIYDRALNEAEVQALYNQ